MPRLRITFLLSVLALLVGVAGTAWLSAWGRLHASPADAAWLVHAPTSKPPPRRTRAARRVTSTSPAIRADPRPPMPLFAPSPRYPIAALRAHREGVVTLDVRLDTRGRVTAVDVAQSSGDPQMDAAARDAVRRWTFQMPAGSAQPPKPLLLPVRFRIGA